MSLCTPRPRNIFATFDVSIQFMAKKKLYPTINIANYTTKIPVSQSLTNRSVGFCINDNVGDTVRVRRSATDRERAKEEHKYHV